MKLNLAVLASVAALASAALAPSSPAFAEPKGFRNTNAPAQNSCSLARCRAIQQSQGWCPSETAVWCPRHMAMGDACTPVPSGRTGKPAC